jgi:glycosyltransferase involved in cell wall biosynthesis
MESDKKIVSIVTPCFNEEDSILNCYEVVKEIFKDLKNVDYEHIFSDNSSTDSTQKILKKIAKEDSNIKVLINSHNVGPFVNNYNALSYATGDYVLIFLPADLQDPPNLIPEMLDKIENGYEIVLGIRNTRLENFFLKLMRTIFYRLMNIFSSHKVPVGAGEFMMITKKIHQIILDSDNDIPYIRGIVAQLNFPKTEIKYTWDKRKFGQSKNSFSDLMDQAINAFIMMSFKPIRFFLYLGALMFTTSFSLLVFNMVKSTEIELILIYCILTIVSFLVFAVGLLGEYLLSINNKVNKGLKLKVIEKYNIE